MRGRLGKLMVAVALAATAVAGVGGWAAGAGQVPAVGLPGSWAGTEFGVRLPVPGVTPPPEVARFFAGLTPAQREALATEHPLVVGNLDGAPVDLRYRANQLAIAQEAAKDSKRAERYKSLTGHRILAFDPRGRGLIAEVYGDLAPGRPTAVIVPGVDNDLMSYDHDKAPYGSPAGMAQALRRATGDQVPVIAWVGYTTPTGVSLDLATEDLAEAGAQRLTRLLDGLAAPATLYCHSYGSVVCGKAALRPGQVRSVVALGSPGMGIGHAADLPVPVWAAERNGGDWIGDVPNVRLFGLGHGTDPTDPAFGARVVTATGSHGHAGYFAPGTASLANFAAIALGRPVSCAATSEECRNVR